VVVRANLSEPSQLFRSEFSARRVANISSIPLRSGREYLLPTSCCGRRPAVVYGGGVSARSSPRPGRIHSDPRTSAGNAGVGSNVLCHHRRSAQRGPSQSGPVLSAARRRLHRGRVELRQDCNPRVGLEPCRRPSSRSRDWWRGVPGRGPGGAHRGAGRLLGSVRGDVASVCDVSNEGEQSHYQYVSAVRVLTADHRGRTSTARMQSSD